MKSIIYKPLITQYKPQSIPDFKPKGYRPQYNWKDSESMPTSEPAPETIPEETSSQETTPTETWINPDGTTLITDPAYQQSPIQRATHIFKDSSINVGNMQELLDKFADAGISLRITSGYRPGAHTKQGNQSWHSQGYALDVTPGTNETWDSLRQKLRNSPELIKYMQDQGFGIIDETTPEMQSRTGATGAHWHIGKDKLAQSGLQDILSARHGIKLPIIAARSGRKLKKQQDHVTSCLYEMADREHKQQHPLTARTDKPLEPVSIASVLPGTGDVAEGASIINDISKGNIGSALLGAGLFMIPGNIPTIIKGTFKGNPNRVFIKRMLDGGYKRIGYLDNVEDVPIEDFLKNYEALKANNSSHYDPTFNKIIIDESKPAELQEEMLDHELIHLLDVNGTEDFTRYKGEREFIKENKLTESYWNRPKRLGHTISEISPRLVQIKNFLNITDGSKKLTGKEWKYGFEQYLKAGKDNNNMRELYEAISNWDKLAEWAHKYVPAIAPVALTTSFISNESENTQ